MGLISPPTIRKTNDGTYEVIAGQRRLHACQKLGWVELEVFIASMDDNDAVGTSLVENMQRADMHPLDKARGLDSLVTRLGSDKDEANTTRLSLTTVRKYLRLLSLLEDLRMQPGTANGPTGVGALATLASKFETPDKQRKAWELVRGFSSGTAQDILRRSEGDLDELEELKEQALSGELGVERCGDSLRECPWLEDLPAMQKNKILNILVED